MQFTDSFAKLNDQQKQAAKATDGYIRVIAGAGSGKTNALTHRFAYLVNKLGIPASDILCVTFTNKAASVMKKRIKQMIGDFGMGRISTFHGFCVQLLKEDGHVLQYPPSFDILDEEDANDLIERCFEKFGVTAKQITVKQAKGAIANWKHCSHPDCPHCHKYCDLFTDPQMMTVLSKARNDMSKLPNNNVDILKKKIYYEYLYEQRKAFALDFTDLICLGLHILRRNEDIRAKWQKRLQYIMVDEFQDVDSDQYELVTILSGCHKNLFVVGDPDQTIYSWRGANVGYILEFDKKFPDVQTINMNINYRSLAKVINASNSLIRKNKNRIEKNLIPHKKGNGQAIYFHAKTQKEESEWIAKQIETIKDRKVSLSKVAILYRAHSVSRSIEESLRVHRLPYRILSGAEFYQRKEVKDVISYLRLIRSGNDQSFLRVVNRPDRRIGKKRIDFLRDYSEKHNCSYLSALSENIKDPLFENTGASAFLSMIYKYKNSYKKYSLTDLLDAILDESDYEKYLRTAGDEERLNNLAELKQSIYEYETTAGEETNLESYLQDIALYTNADKDDDAESVKLMTIHSAKGLEFPYVFVCSLNEGIFPSQQNRVSEKIEEERRLAYVAFTRAEDMLVLSDSEGINFDGSFRYPSRFIFDTEQANLDYVVPLLAHLIDQVTNTDSPDIGSSVFHIGSKVVHEVFGNGEILSIDEDKSCYLILFETIATPKMIRFNAPLNEVKPINDSTPF